ncbi:GATA zinc finger domain-containing protein 14-like [Hydractinia symbiolongicarpus]|uniref:GATA zinc finger domain-containing protein 14-like n=1 Tax=Hydractinia symbiolongicarpus TaxID=13093 RepID=UPI00254C08F0|nr:GATA zinc finger domain-containing protein 14-like [Hydractinia symbiolongicarpus]
MAATDVKTDEENIFNKMLEDINEEMNIEHNNVTVKKGVYKELNTTLNAEDFIDKHYEKTRYSALRDSILEDVKGEINTLISNQISKLVNNCSVAHKDDRTDKLESNLLEEIQFLRQEIQSKNEIIKILVENSVEHNYSTKSLQQENFNSFQTVNKKNKNRSTIISNNNEAVSRHNNQSFVHRNRFEHLYNENNDHSEITESFRGDTYNNNNFIHNNEELIVHNNEDIIVHNNKENIPTKRQSLNNANNIINTKKITFILKSFPGATTEDMYEYVKPTMKKKPDNIILHVGTNDLSRNVAPEVIANDIINLATSLINSNMNVSVSGLTPRNDDQGIRCDELNDHLYKGCAERNIAFINHYQQMDRNRHLNRSKLHLNQYGSVTLANSFLNFISKD